MTTTLRFFIADAAKAIGDCRSELPRATPAAERIKSRRESANWRASSSGLVEMRLTETSLKRGYPGRAEAEFAFADGAVKWRRSLEMQRLAYGTPGRK